MIQNGNNKLTQVQTSSKENVVENPNIALPNTMDKPSMSPEEAAATLFFTYFPKFKQMLGQLSKNQMHRLIIALIETPLHDVPYIPRGRTHEFQKNLFEIGDRLLTSKYLMIMHTFKEKLDAAQKEESEKVESETKEVG